MWRKFGLYPLLSPLSRQAVLRLKLSPSIEGDSGGRRLRFIGARTKQGVLSKYPEDVDINYLFYVFL
jgi:hypothetical protein